MIKVICKICGKEFETYSSRIKVRKGVFCSNECKYKFKKGKPTWNAGKKCPTLSASKMGSKNPMWKGGYDKKKSDREYGIKNRKKIMLKQKLWNEKNIVKVRESKNKWAKNNPEKRAIIYNRRREREIMSGGSLTEREWKEIKKFQNNKCKICGLKKKLTIDHVIPISKWIEWSNKNKPRYKCGDKQNIQALCGKCNSKKFNKLST